MVGSHPSNSFSRSFFHELCATLRRCIVRLSVSWVWERKKHGSTRSFVRRLGKCLSLTPCRRPHLQLVQKLNYLDSEPASTPSLGDVLLVPNDDRYTKFRFVEWRQIVTPAVPVPSPSTENLFEGTVVEEAAFKKISALENELAHLRRQIAAIVAVRKEVNDSSCSNIGNSSNTPSKVLQQAAMTSTPVSTSPCSVLVPPPPPPPLPAAGLLSSFDPCNSGLLKEHRTPNKKRNITSSGVSQETKTVPCMMDVLKDINKVKLRAIDRSPGGTPLPKTKKIMQPQWDPATLIAEALKEKFASHLNDDDSFDKENRSSDASPFSSPGTPMIGNRILKPGMMQTFHRTEKQNSTPSKTRVQI